MKNLPRIVTFIVNVVKTCVGQSSKSSESSVVMTSFQSRSCPMTNLKIFQNIKSFYVQTELISNSKLAPFRIFPIIVGERSVRVVYGKCGGKVSGWTGTVFIYVLASFLEIDYRRT